MDLWGPIPAGVERSIGDEVDRPPEIVYHKPAVNAKEGKLRDNGSRLSREYGQAQQH